MTSVSAFLWPLDVEAQQSVCNRYPTPVCRWSQQIALNRIAEQQSMRMYVLSLVTAIFLPLSFLTGVFGMNVVGLPALSHPRLLIP